MEPSNFSKWMRTNLKDAYSGLITQDIDFIIKFEKEKYLIAEEKIFSRARTGPAQAVIYKLLSEILENDSNFYGCHKITVNKDETVYINEIKTTTLIDFFSNPRKIYLNSYNETWYDKSLFFNLKYMWDCNGLPKKTKTESERTFSRESNLKELLIKSKIEFSKIDWLFLNYCSGFFAILYEENIDNNITNKRIVEQLEIYNKNDKKVKNPKSKAEYKFLGTYIIKHSKNFDEFYINGIKITKSEAIAVLNLENDKILKYK